MKQRMRGIEILKKGIAAGMCTILLLSVFVGGFFSAGIKQVSAAVGTSKGELPQMPIQPEEKKEPGKTEQEEEKTEVEKHEILLPDLKLPTIEVYGSSYVKTVENREIMTAPDYRVVSMDESVCHVEKVSGRKWDESQREWKEDKTKTWWELRGVKYGTTTIQIFKTVNGKEEKYAIYRVNILYKYITEKIQEQAVIQKGWELPMGMIDTNPLNGRYFLISGADPNAEYVFESKDGKIVNNEAVKPGKTTITVKEIKNGKTRVIGKTERMIKEAKLSLTKDTIILEDTISYSNYSNYIEYENKNAAYHLEPEGDFFQFQKKEEYANGLETNVYRAVKPGKTKIKLVETYKGETKVVGTISVTITEKKNGGGSEEVKLPEAKLITDHITVNKFNWRMDISSLVENNLNHITMKVADTSIIECDEFSSYFMPKKKGTTEVTILQDVSGYDAASGKYLTQKKELGKISVTVADSMVKSGIVEIELDQRKWNKYGFYSSWDISNCILNPINDSGFNYMALEKGTKNLYEYDWYWKRVVNDYSYTGGHACGKADYLIFENYMDLIVPVGEVTVNIPTFYDQVWNTNATHEIGINDTMHISNYMVWGWTYDDTIRYSVGNKNILKVKNNIIYPQKKGTTTITVKAKKNGKMQTLGTIKIKVTDQEVILRNETYEDYFRGKTSYPLQDFILFYHPKATYTCKISDTSVASYNKKTKKFTIKETGETDITIYETYKGKKQKVGTMHIIMKSQE